MSRFSVSLAVLWAICDSSSVTQAESCPALPELVANSRLIVYGRMELVDDRLLCRVVKSLKGNARTTAFVDQSPAGFVDPIHAPFYLDLDAGEKVFLFYVDHNQPRDRVGRPDLGVIVRDERVVYPPSDGELDLLRCDIAPVTIKQFQRRIAELASPPTTKPPTRDHWQLAGPWKLMLPAGYEHEVTFTPLGDNRYRVEPGSLNLAGHYELRGDRLVRIPDDAKPDRVYEWQIRSHHMLHLAQQPTESRPADYSGAMLFRPNTAKP